MAWIKLDDRIKKTRIYRAICRPMGERDSGAPMRFATLIQIMIASANGTAWDTPKDISAEYLCTQKQAQIVWDACIEHGVLTPCESGYTAEPWLRAQGMLGNAGETPKARKEATAPEPAAPCAAEDSDLKSQADTLRAEIEDSNEKMASIVMKVCPHKTKVAAEAAALTACPGVFPAPFDEIASRAGEARKKLKEIEARIAPCDTIARAPGAMQANGAKFETSRKWAYRKEKAIL